jgi:DNA modification methylase
MVEEDRRRGGGVLIADNTIYHADVMSILPGMEDLGIDLAIIDPPYFGVVGEDWDNQWSSLDGYLAWTNLWVQEVARVMRYSGSVYIYGCTKSFLTLSSLGRQFQDAGFEFRQEIVIDKGIKSVSGRTSKSHKCFPMVTENILYFVKDAKPFVRGMLKERQVVKGYTAKEMNERMGFRSNGGGNWTKYAGDTNFPLLPTECHWDKLRGILGFDMPYNKVGITFNTDWGITNVWDDIDFYNEERIHPTQKPVKLAERLISVSSNKGDLVLDLFAGSANVSMACRESGRRFVGIEACKEYYDKAAARVGRSHCAACPGP